MHFLCLLAVWWPGSQSARVFLSDGHNYEPHKNGWTDRGAVWDTDSGGTKHALCVGLALPGRRVNLRGVSRPMVKWREYSACIRYSQPYSIAGSRDVAFRCQYTAATYYLNAWTAGLRLSVAEWLARLTAVWEDPGSNHATDSCVYRDGCCDIESWARAVHLYCSA